MWFFKFILSLLHVFYVGILIVVCLILGLFNPFFYTVAKILFVAWILYGIADQIILAKVMRDSPELQEIVNATIANTMPGGRGIPEGEVVLCELPAEDRKLVGRCLNPEKEHWSIRLLYEGSYQMFSWNLVYNKDFLPQMAIAEGKGVPEGSLWIKCYEMNEDGVARWNLHLLQRKGEVFEDIALDYATLVENVSEAYNMDYKETDAAITLTAMDSAPDWVAQQRVVISNRGIETAPMGICYGRMSMIDLEQNRFYLSIGPRYEDFPGGEIAGYYVIGTYYYDNGKLCWKDVHIENISK